MGVSTAAPARKRRRGNGAPLIKISVSPSNNINIRWTTVLPPNSARERDTRFWKTSPRGAQFVRGHLRNNLFEQPTIRVLPSKMQSNLQRVLRRTPLAYGTLLAGLPLMLGAMIGPWVGFGPCGPSVRSSIRLAVIVAGILAISSPFVAAWLFWISFRNRRALTAIIGLPLLAASGFICLYWLFVLFSALMG